MSGTTLGSAGEAALELPEVKMSLVKPTAPVVGRVVRNERCVSAKASGFVRHVEIDVSGTPLAGAFRAGQSFGVIPPGTDARGKPHKVRLYSIAAPSCGEDGAGQVLSTTVKRTIDEHWETRELFLGVTSNFLCDLHEGDEAPVSGPNGKRFLLPVQTEAHDYLFIATGTGVAPFRGMSQELLSAGTMSRIALIKGAPYATDLIYDDLFRELEQAHANFTHRTAISRHAQEDGRPPMYVHQRLEADRDELQEMLESERTLLYVCGIAGMELGVAQTLARMLTPEQFAQYFELKAEAPADAAQWTSAMIPRQIRPTSRVFLEVY